MSFTFKFSPMSRYWIPKPNKAGKMRAITQPNQRDIIVMESLSVLLNIINLWGKRKIGKMPSQAMYYYWPYNDGIVDLFRIPVLWTELDVAFHSLGSEKAKGKGWVAPLFRGTAVVTEHGKDARRSPRKPSLAWRLTQHNRRAEPTPTITVTRRAGG